MRPVIPDDLFNGPTVELPSGLAADAFQSLANVITTERNMANEIRAGAVHCGPVPVNVALRIARDLERNADILEQTHSALDFGRVTPGDDDATEN